MYVEGYDRQVLRCMGSLSELRESWIIGGSTSKDKLMFKSTIFKVNVMIFTVVQRTRGRHSGDFYTNAIFQRGNHSYWHINAHARALPKYGKRSIFVPLTALNVSKSVSMKPQKCRLIGSLCVFAWNIQSDLTRSECRLEHWKGLSARLPWRARASRYKTLIFRATALSRAAGAPPT